MMDLYRVLGVAPEASRDAIVRAYRRLARRYHPDINTSPEAAERFDQITHAYQVLADPAARARYDATRVNVHHIGHRHQTRRPPWTPTQGWGSGPRTATFWLGDVGQSQTGDVWAASRENGTRSAGSGATRRTGDEDNNNGEEDVEVELSLAEAFHGATRTVTVTSSAGSVAIPIAIPAGMITGQRLQINVPGQPPGSAPVYLRIRLADHDRYRIDGRDLHVDVPLTPWEAALGTTITLPAPAGPALLTVPPCTSSGDLITLTGQGLPNPAGTPGNLHAHAVLVLPPTLTVIEHELFTRLAGASRFNPRTPPVNR